jgi:hypothetical protein
MSALAGEVQSKELKMWNTILAVFIEALIPFLLSLLEPWIASWT